MTITVTETKEVKISEKNKKEIALHFLYENFNWKPCFYLKEEDGSVFVYSSDFVHSSHSFILDVKIREALEEDILFSKLLSRIKK
jgi:hypothetical protein